MDISPISSIEKFINQMLQLDEVAFEEIKKLSGKRIHINIDIIHLDIYLGFSTDGISITGRENQAVDVKIKATPMNFLRMAMQGKDDIGSNVAILEITGDVGLARKFQSILMILDIDWEDYFSGWIGDYPARKFGLFIHRFRHYLSETGESFCRDISEYLRYEKETVPLIDEVASFNREVDDLRNYSDRIQQRINRLERLINS